MELEDSLEPQDDVRPIAPLFVVRMLTHGMCEVLLEQNAETPPRHISDFRSKDEAQTWIEENAASWARKVPYRR